MTKLKVGMIGGGGGFFGKVHQRAISLDATREVVAGALHQDPALSAKFADEWGVKGYSDYKAMIDDWKAGKLGLDYVTIVTPNFLHAEQALYCINAGLPVLCEKPLSYSLDEALALQKAVKARKKAPFAISHTYTGHPLMMLARELIKQGKVGTIRKIETYYNQGWLYKLAEKEGNQQASWRTDPKKSGISGCGGDIGTHALINALWVSGLGLKAVSALLTAIPGRRLDDDFNAFGKLSNGATLVLTATQIAIGHKNDTGWRIYGDKGTLEWAQEQSEELHFLDPSCTRTTIYQNALPAETPDVIRSYGRLPPGHHEDFFEALANLHTSLERKIRKLNGEKDAPPAYDHPGVDEGVLGMKFLTAAVESSKNKGAWTPV